MKTTHAALDALSVRIQRAFRLRHPKWYGGCSSSRVWDVAAARLVEATEADDGIPLDPELFVASQPVGSSAGDPWLTLTGRESVLRYRERVRSIVRRLNVELSDEIRSAERRIEAGQSVSQVVGRKSGRISPLGRYLVAVRASRPQLASRFLEAAVVQHYACPLYRQASVGLIPASDYPVVPGYEVRPVTGQHLIGNRALSTVIQN